MTPESERARQREATARYRAKHPERIVAQKMRYRGGIRPEDWSAMWVKQDGKCYLCGSDLIEGKTHLDHDHRCCPPTKACSTCWRGLACGKCNQLIGLANDDPDRLETIAANLRLARLSATRRLAARLAAQGDQGELTL